MTTKKQKKQKHPAPWHESQSRGLRVKVYDGFGERVGLGSKGVRARIVAAINAVEGGADSTLVRVAEMSTLVLLIESRLRAKTNSDSGTVEIPDIAWNQLVKLARGDR